MKYILLLLLCFSVSFSQAQPIYSQGSTLEEYESFLQKFDTLKFHLYQLTNEREYDSIIAICKTGIKEDKYNHYQETYNTFLASTYYLKGNKDSAYLVALNYIKKKSEGIWILEDILRYSNYLLFYPLATDVVFQNKILDLYLADYKKRHYANTPLGTELLRLHYLNERMELYAKYGAIMVHDSVMKKAISQNLEMLGKANDSLYMALVKRHPQLIKESEVGHAYNSQFVLLDHITDNGIRQNILLPMLKTAMDKDEINPYVYVKQLARTAILNNSIKQEDYYVYLDSLCKIYHCKNVVFNVK